MSSGEVPGVFVSKRLLAAVQEEAKAADIETAAENVHHARETMQRTVRETRERIAEIRAGAIQSIEEVARDVAADVDFEGGHQWTIYLSPRGYHRIRRVARTIADLAGRAEIDSEAVSEAIHYRSLDREFWKK